jgi:HEAT repeat protein
MKVNRKIILLVGVIAVSVFLVIWHFMQPERKEPVYHGKTLTKWLKQLDDGEVGGISSSQLPSRTPEQIEATEAIHDIGAEALPYLMEDIHLHPREDAFRFRMQRRLNDFLRRWFGTHIYFDDTTEEDRVRWRAAQGLAALGPLARPAVPELQRLLLTNFWHSSIKEAAYALATVGPEGAAILTNAVQPTTEWSGMCAIWALGQHPAAGTNFIPFLISATSSPSEGTSEGAIQVLGLFHTDAEEVIPALTRALTGTNSSVAGSAAWALGKFGPQAASAVPLLQSLTINPAIKDNAIQALKKIQSR